MTGSEYSFLKIVDQSILFLPLLWERESKGEGTNGYENRKNNAHVFRYPCKARFVIIYTVYTPIACSCNAKCASGVTTLQFYICFRPVFGRTVKACNA